MLVKLLLWIFVLSGFVYSQRSSGSTPVHTKQYHIEDAKDSLYLKLIPHLVDSIVNTIREKMADSLKRDHCEPVTESRTKEEFTGGIVVADTRTSIGYEFYKVFSREVTLSGCLDSVSGIQVIIKDKQLPKNKTLIGIVANDQLVNSFVFTNTNLESQIQKCSESSIIALQQLVVLMAGKLPR